MLVATNRMDYEIRGWNDLFRVVEGLLGTL